MSALSWLENANSVHAHWSFQGLLAPITSPLARGERIISWAQASLQHLSQSQHPQNRCTHTCALLLKTRNVHIQCLAGCTVLCWCAQCAVNSVQREESAVLHITDCVWTKSFWCIIADLVWSGLGWNHCSHIRSSRSDGECEGIHWNSFGVINRFMFN